MTAPQSITIWEGKRVELIALPDRNAFGLPRSALVGETLTGAWPIGDKKSERYGQFLSLRVVSILPDGGVETEIEYHRSLNALLAAHPNAIRLQSCDPLNDMAQQVGAFLKRDDIVPAPRGIEGAK